MISLDHEPRNEMELPYITTEDFKIVQSNDASRPYLVLTTRRNWNCGMGRYRTESDAKARIRSLVKQQRCPMC